MSANPHANGGILLKDLRLPDFRDYAIEVTVPGKAFAHKGTVPWPVRKMMGKHRS
jgi:phosphoketolase